MKKNEHFSLKISYCKNHSTKNSVTKFVSHFSLHAYLTKVVG